MKWNEILKRGEYSPEEPDKLAMQFRKLLQNKRAQRVLDLGCGTGRHTVYLAKQGFETHGIDISETGLRKTRNKLQKEKLDASLVKCDMKALPYIPHCFDAVMSLYTIYHNTKQGIRKAIEEIHRTLTKTGLTLLNFHTKHSSKHGKGTQIEENTFIQENGPEKGVIHHFVDENEIHQLLKGFKILKLQIEEHETEGYLRSHLAVMATKD